MKLLLVAWDLYTAQRSQLFETHAVALADLYVRHPVVVVKLRVQKKWEFMLRNLRVHVNFKC